MPASVVEYPAGLARKKQITDVSVRAAARLSASSGDVESASCLPDDAAWGAGVVYSSGIMSRWDG